MGSQGKSLDAEDHDHSYNFLGNGRTPVLDRYLDTVGEQRSGLRERSEDLGVIVCAENVTAIGVGSSVG